MRSHLLPALFALSAMIGVPVEPNEVAGAFLQTGPKIDGMVSDSEWAAASKAEGFVDMMTGSKAGGGTFFLGYDAKYVYFAARLDVDDPSQLRADEYRENVSLLSDDAVYLQIETFGQLANFNSFGVNSRGATSIQIAGGRAPKREWVGEMLAAGHRTPSGYEVEARIPWGIMRLPEPGRKTLRFNVMRNNPTQGRSTAWRATRGNPENTGRWTDVEIPTSGNKRSLKILPYAYGGFGRDQGIANGGLDLKTSLTDKIEAVGSISPDFRNIENQILSLDFSYFERLAGESRPFFLEGGSFFSTSLDNPIFASQRIRTFDAGFKTFGQINDNTDVAFLDTIDVGERNSLAARISHRPTSTSSFVLAGTGLSQHNGPDNDTWFASYFQSRGALGFFGQMSETKDTDSGRGRRINSGIVYGKKEWSGSAEFLHINNGYNPRLGFAPERDLQGFKGQISYLKPTPGPVMEYGGDVEAYDYRRIGGDPYRRGVSGSSTTTWSNGLDLDLAAQYEVFEGNNDLVFAGSLELPRGNAYRRWEVGGSAGRIAGRRYQTIGLSAAYKPLAKLQASLRLQSQQHVDRRTQTILSASYDISKTDSVAGRAVRSSRDTNFYIAYRRTGNRGAEYYVILGDPNARSFRTSLVIKAVFPIELRF